MEMYSKLNRCKHKGLQVYSSCTVAVVSLDVGPFVVIVRGCDTVSSLFFLGAAAGSPYIVFKLTFSYGFMLRIYIYI